MYDAITFAANGTKPVTLTRILTIEDDLITAQEIMALLQERGYGVGRASEGSRGLVHMLSGNDASITTGLMFPSVDGRTIIKAMRAMRSKTSVRLLSAPGGMDEGVRSLRAGGGDLTRSFAPEEFATTLEVLLCHEEDAPHEHATLALGTLGPLTKTNWTAAGPSMQTMRGTGHMLGKGS